MALHIAARFHAFVHGLFRMSDRSETKFLYRKVEHLFRQARMLEEGCREALVIEMAGNVLSRFEIGFGHWQAVPIIELISELLDYEGMFDLPEIDWRERRTVAEWWDLRDALNHQKQFVDDFEGTKTQFVQAVIQMLGIVFDNCPTLLQDVAPDALSISTHLTESLADPGAATQNIMVTFFADELVGTELFQNLTNRLEYNLAVASGGKPNDPSASRRAPKAPAQSEIKDPGELLSTYLAGTPLLAFFDQRVDFNIPDKSRFEHHHIVAGSGHGKTQTLQYLIAQDIEAMADEPRTVIVLDSQGDLIRNIANLEVFAPDGPLHDKIVIIDPSDVEYPVSLNLFDVGLDRLETYGLLERERLTNSILELYDFVLGTLLSAEMTQKQNVIFRYVTRLMLHIPNATIHTLLELMEQGSEEQFVEHIAELQGTAKHFFETEFGDREFQQTRKQVRRKLWGILENQTFERMFSHPRSKLDLFSEMNAGKVILINTAKDLLKEQGTEIFGRFFIALIAQAAQERATLPEHKRTPTFVYVDEAADYFDRNIGLILAQARKYNVGMILAHQFLGQLDPRLQDAFAANTSIKFAGGVSSKDARALASMLYADQHMIKRQPKGSFAAFVRGVTKSALPFGVPPVSWTVMGLGAPAL